MGCRRRQLPTALAWGPPCRSEQTGTAADDKCELIGMACSTCNDVLKQGTGVARETVTGRLQRSVLQPVHVLARSHRKPCKPARAKNRQQGAAFAANSRLLDSAKLLSSFCTHIHTSCCHFETPRASRAALVLLLRTRGCRKAAARLAEWGLEIR
jgi:hypothetical protein